MLLSYVKIILTPVIAAPAFSTKDATEARPTEVGELTAKAIPVSPLTPLRVIAIPLVLGGMIVTPVAPVGTVMVLFPLESENMSL
jgi:hypothetical protein